jgi:ubiquinone/menaquinone biosynthesis C-methylase UbiE
MSVEMMEYYVAEQHGARKFHGAVAEGYDQKREESPKWQIEQKIIEDMLGDLQMGEWVLDVPCGTGRFFHVYHDKKVIYHGVDLSDDMLEQAAQKVKDPNRTRLRVGDVRKLGMHDKSVDVSVMCRLTRWLSPADCVQALRELQRVTRRKIILTARVRNHPHARSYELIQSALDGWKIHRDEAGADMDYRIIELRPC